MLMYLIRYRYLKKLCVFGLFNQISITYCVFFIVCTYNSSIWKFNLNSTEFLLILKSLSFFLNGVSVNTLLNMKEKNIFCYYMFLAT